MGLTDPELSVVLTDDEEIRELNREWRDEDEVTDVLSFPLHEPFEVPDFPGIHLGDVVISIETAERICAADGHRDRVAENLRISPEELSWSLEDEVDFLLIHAILHLVGHDHLDEEDSAEMRAEERRLWLHARDTPTG